MERSILFVLLVAFVALACASPHSRNKRFAGAYAGAFPGYPFGGGSFAGPIGAYTGSPWNFGRSAFGASPWDFPSPFMPPFGYFPFPSYFPAPINWYDGENVCKEVKNVDSKTPDVIAQFFKDEDYTSSGSSSGGSSSSSSSGHSQFNHEQESCKGSDNTYTCVKRSFDGSGKDKIQVTKYQCCHGFVRNPSGPGCIEIDLKNLIPTLRSIGATTFVSWAEEASMADALHTDNYTVFCPTNAALEDVPIGQETDIDNAIVAPSVRHRLKKRILLHDLLTEHMVSGFNKLDDFSDEQLIEAEHNDSRIRINIYYTPEKIMTANCVPIVSGDHFARNGIVHMVEKVLPVATKSVADIIAGDAQFSVLKGMLSRAGLVQTLRNPNRTFTVFAPTDSSFSHPQKTPPDVSNDRCTVSIMKHHIVGHVICSSAIPPFAKSLNLIGELLSVSRDRHNKLYVDEVQIVVRDLVATNGVVHVIDGLLSTRQAKTASQIMREYGLRQFLALVEAANLKTLYDSLENVTFFIPSDEAIRALPAGLLESLMSNIDSLFSILLYHVASGRPEINRVEQVLYSKLENTSIRVQVYSPYPHASPQILVQCATVLSPGNKMCGGSLHVINKLLLPPKLSIVEVLESLEGFSTLILLLRMTGLERRLMSLDTHHTLLAPHAAQAARGQATGHRSPQDAHSLRCRLLLPVEGRPGVRSTTGESGGRIHSETGEVQGRLPEDRRRPHRGRGHHGLQWRHPHGGRHREARRHLPEDRGTSEQWIH